MLKYLAIVNTQQIWCSELTEAAWVGCKDLGNR
jgi:hypothetical protein